MLTRIKSYFFAPKPVPTMFDNLPIEITEHLLKFVPAPALLAVEKTNCPALQNASSVAQKQHDRSLKSLEQLLKNLMDTPQNAITQTEIRYFLDKINLLLENWGDRSNKSTQDCEAILKFILQIMFILSEHGFIPFHYNVIRNNVSVFGLFNEIEEEFIPLQLIHFDDFAEKNTSDKHAQIELMLQWSNQSSQRVIADVLASFDEDDPLEKIFTTLEIICKNLEKIICEEHNATLTVRPQWGQA